MKANHSVSCFSLSVFYSVLLYKFIFVTFHLLHTIFIYIKEGSLWTARYILSRDVHRGSNICYRTQQHQKRAYEHLPLEVGDRIIPEDLRSDKYNRSKARQQAFWCQKPFTLLMSSWQQTWDTFYFSPLKNRLCTFLDVLIVNFLSFITITTLFKLSTKI